MQAAHFLPAVWLLNRLTSVYLDLARFLLVAPPEGYLEVHMAFLNALEEGRTDDAVAIFGAYLDDHDRALLARLEVEP